MLIVKIRLYLMDKLIRLLVSCLVLMDQYCKKEMIKNQPIMLTAAYLTRQIIQMNLNFVQKHPIKKGASSGKAKVKDC